MCSKAEAISLDPVITFFASELRARHGTMELYKSELATELNCSVSTIDKRIMEGRNIPRYRKAPNGRVTFNVLDVAKYLVSTNLVEVA
jgi:hypothetical protein